MDPENSDAVFGKVATPTTAASKRRPNGRGLLNRRTWDNVKVGSEPGSIVISHLAGSRRPNVPIMKRLSAAILIMSLTAGALPAAEEPPTKARALLLSGKYAEAAEVYGRTAAKDPAAAIGVARCLAARGRLDEAVRSLAPLAKGQAAVEAELAALAFERGEWKEAAARADEAIRLERRQLLARWIRAELDRVTGRLDEANAGCKWFIAYYNDNDVTDAEALRYVGLAAAQYARWNRLADQFDFVVNELYPEALKADGRFWPAHYEAGLLYLEKHNEADAAAEFKKALVLNPNAAEVHAAIARLAIDNRDIEKANASVDRALEINPRLLAAWHVRADLLWANYQPEEAVKLLKEKALPLCPVSEETLGRLAACYALLDAPGEGKSDARLARLTAEVNARNAHAGDFYFAMAERLEGRSKLPAAERMFREAIRRMPQKIGPRAGLGMLCMRAGREDEARTVLKEAFDVDPFNVRVNNLIEVLGVLDGMETLETGQVVLRFSGQQDKLLAEYAAGQLDGIYAELCKQFGYRPPGKPLIEVFSQAKGAGGHQWFSTRLIGLPYVGTVAASTGQIVAMVSPNEPELARHFNWLRVLKHELVHVITLQQTDFNCPHWYTEALAVWSEGQPRPQVWSEVLVRRARRGDLFTLETINFGFIRPHSSDDWTLAYCQAELYLEYLLKNHGQDVIRKLLAAYAENLSTSEALRRVCGVSQEEFERGYRTYVEKLVGEMASLAEGEGKDLGELLKQRKTKPEDPDLAADLAAAYVRRGADKEAGQLAAEALKRKPRHPLATYIVARLLVKDDKAAEARRLLEECLDPQRPQPMALNLLAGLTLKAEQYDEAARLYAMGQKHDPYNLKWTQSLAGVYLAAKNDAKLAEVLARLAQADEDDLLSRKKLARLALDRKDYAAAITWCREALAINVKDAEVRRALAEAHLGRHNHTEAIRQFETAVALDPEEPHQRFALADACVQAGQTQRARKVLQELLRLVPDYPGAEVMLESLEEGQTKPTTKGEKRQVKP
jgi:Flp pilus assembly protein TadD